ncbi:hypothetical protein [Streptomyces youssoufiensis]
MRTALAVTAALLLGLTVTACSDDSEPSVSACKQAMQKQLQDAKDGATGSRPSACNGVDDATLQKIAAELIGSEVEKGMEDAVEKELGELD